MQVHNFLIPGQRVRLTDAFQDLNGDGIEVSQLGTILDAETYLAGEFPSNVGQPDVYLIFLDEVEGKFFYGPIHLEMEEFEPVEDFDCNWASLRL